MKGKLFGVGVGPGDPELLTIKAVRAIEKSQVIAVASREAEKAVAFKIAKGAVCLEGKEVVSIFMPMTKEEKILEERHKMAAEKVCQFLNQGKNVSFLTLGDPAVFSTYMYIHSMVKALGFDAEIISGVTSFSAAAARLGISLCEREESLHIVPATYEKENLEEVFSLKGTKVLMKSGKEFSYVREKLISSKKTAFMVENCGMENERVFYGAENFPETTGYYTLIIIKE